MKSYKNSKNPIKPVKNLKKSLLFLIFRWMYVICSRKSIPFGRQLSPILSVQTCFLKQFSKLLLINIVALVYRGTHLKDFQLSHEFRKIVEHKRDLTLLTIDRSKKTFFQFFLLILTFEMCFLLYH